MSILVLAEHDNAELKPATLNTVTAAKAIGGDIHVLVAGEGCGGVADAAAKIDGVSKVLAADAPDSPVNQAIAKMAQRLLNPGSDASSEADKKRHVGLFGRLFSSSVS